MVTKNTFPQILYKDRQSMYVKVEDTVFKVTDINSDSIYKIFKTKEKSQKRTTGKEQTQTTEGMINISVEDYISVLSKMLKEGYFVGTSNEIEKRNIKSVRKDKFTGYGEITLVLKNEEIDAINKAISDKYTLANIVVADNKEFDRILLSLKANKATSKIYESTKAYIRNSF